MRPLTFALTLMLIACDDKETTDSGTPIVDDTGEPGDTDDTDDPDTSDADADGFTTEDGDCDDSNPDINPDAEEVWYDGIDQDCDGASDYDADGDGVDSSEHGGEDCDDTDSEVYPGADDAWYDGVDSNCDGASDYDADGDGHDADAKNGGGDCDDTDATISPDAKEVWYDGIDSDCDGASDYDADGDGFLSDKHGGDDCDDADGAINPDAEETWYDDIDGNCDGENDFDADGDGTAASEYGGLDCDDTDATVNIDAAEIWYDGTDQDCDGASDYDADGDGFDSDGYGGTDCDDTDSAINTDATETWYDGTDSDCDGASDYDADGDGYDSDSYSGDDCDDRDSAVNPDATDTPQDGTDQDCDGEDAPYTLSDLSEGDLLINEIMQNPSVVSDSYGEWFELYNASGGEVDLDGMYVYDINDSGAVNTDFTVSGELRVEAGGYVVLGVDSDATINGGVTVDYDYSSFSLGNSDDELYLAESSKKGTIFDSIEWDNGDTFPDPSGYSMSLDAAYLDLDNNDYGFHWCESTTSFGDGDYGTPGSANDSCGFSYSHDSDIQTVWDTNCTGCHGGASPSASLSLEDGWTSAVLVGSGQASGYNLIEPTDSYESYLYLKLIDEHSDIGSGDAMPLYSSALSSTELDMIETWIDEGAPR